MQKMNRKLYCSDITILVQPSESSRAILERFFFNFIADCKFSFPTRLGIIHIKMNLFKVAETPGEY